MPFTAACKKSRVQQQHYTPCKSSPNNSSFEWPNFSKLPVGQKSNSHGTYWGSGLIQSISQEKDAFVQTK